MLPRFVGRIAQVPPRHAALKTDGRKYYEYAREGVEIERTPAKSEVHDIALGRGVRRRSSFAVHCGKGTYMRALAEDIGEALGCGAHLTALSRTGAAEFALADAITLDALAMRSEAERDAALATGRCAGRTDWTRLDFDDVEATRLVQGQPVTRAGAARRSGRESMQRARSGGVADVREGVVQARRLVAQPQRRATDA